MLDINLGNKTLVVGVLVALILSYGMVNFDSNAPSTAVVPALRAAVDSVTPVANAGELEEDVTGGTADQLRASGRFPRRDRL